MKNHYCKYIEIKMCLFFETLFCFVIDKGSNDSMKFTGSQIGKQAAAKSKGLFSADDWMCSKYDFVDNVTHATTL